MCRIDYCEGEWVTLTDPHEVKARKEHKCSNCERAILPGERYHTGCWIDREMDNAGVLVTVKYCAHCRVAAGWLQKVCGGFLWGDWQVTEELDEHWEEEPQFRCRSFAHLIAAMHKKWDGTTLSKAESLTRFATAHAVREIQAAADRGPAPHYVTRGGV